MLCEARERRNRLAHWFFRPEGELTSPETTAQTTVEELQTAATLFRHVSTRLEHEVHEILGQLHISRFEVESRLSSLRSKDS